MTTGYICGHSDSTRSQTLARFHLLHGFCNLHPNYGALMMFWVSTYQCHSDPVSNRSLSGYFPFPSIWSHEKMVVGPFGEGSGESSQCIIPVVLQTCSFWAHGRLFSEWILDLKISLGLTTGQRIATFYWGSSPQLPAPPFAPAADCRC